MPNKTAKNGKSGKIARRRRQITIAPEVETRGYELAKSDGRSFPKELEFLIEAEYARRKQPVEVAA